MIGRTKHHTPDALDLQKAFVIHARERTFPLHRKVTAVAGHRALEDIP